MAEQRRTLAELTRSLGDRVSVVGNPDTVVTSITHDSRQVVPGSLFCAVPGTRTDGHRFAAAVVEAGAAALLVERLQDVAVPQLLTADARIAMAPLAAAFHGHPSHRLKVIGVTGTNGKTTVTHLLASILNVAGRSTAVLGTLSGARTTPEAPELQATLSGLVDDGRVAVAMEVSSHALTLHRVDAMRFAVAVFTNLSRDHLDFHESMEAYFKAKARLFDADLAERAVVNLDDPHGRLLRDAALVPTVGYSLDEAGDIGLSVAGTRFSWRGTRMFVPLAGRHNLSNAIAAATVAAELGVATDAIAAGLEAVTPVPGRFQSVVAGQSFGVVVDYAHTPDALENVLEAARELTPAGRVLVVFGCGGDRDSSKRAPMGEVASRLADVVVITSDNPRGEPPLSIIDQVRSGVVPGADVQISEDRRAAIALAFDAARPGDLVVIAGKGHESTQTVGDRELPFDDRAVASELLGGAR